MTHIQRLSIMVCALGLLTTAAAAQETSSSRPVGFSVGIGAGWEIPASIDELDTTSVRFRLANGLTIEPRVTLAVASDEDTFGGTTQENTTSALAVAAIARWPLVSRGPVDFLVTGGAVIETLKFNPDGDDNTQKTTTLAAVYGLAVEYWWGPRWTFSFTATNPIFERIKETADSPIPGAETESVESLFGAIFVPDVVAMIHLFY